MYLSFAPGTFISYGTDENRKRQQNGSFHPVCQRVGGKLKGKDTPGFRRKPDEGFDCNQTTPYGWSTFRDGGFERTIEPSPSSRGRATLHRSIAFRWVRIPESDANKKRHPNGRSSYKDEGFEHTMEPSPSSRGRATLHRSVAFKWVRIPIRWQKIKPHPTGVVLFFGRG